MPTACGGSGCGSARGVPGPEHDVAGVTVWLGPPWGRVQGRPLWALACRPPSAKGDNLGDPGGGILNEKRWGAGVERMTLPRVRARGLCASGGGGTVPWRTSTRCP